MPKQIKTVTILVLISIWSLLISSCSASTPNADATAIADAYIRTQAAASVKLTLTAAAPAAQDNPTPQIISTDTPVVPNTDTPTSVPATDTPQPTPSQTPVPQVDCSDKAKFVEETVPDNTAFQPGQVFTKSWTLQNAGTCTWTTAYSFFYDSGEKMGAQASILIPQAVPPQSQITLSLSLTAPTTPGTYQSDYKLKNASGVSFGVGKNADSTVWVKIKVVETDSSLNLGEPTWTDKFDVKNGLWPIYEDAFTKYDIKDGFLTVSALTQAGDLWRVVTYPAVSNQYVQAVFKTTTSCTGKNSYGFIIRSYAQGDLVYDSGYVIAFSCDGMYRIYSMDNSTYANIKDWTAADNLLKGDNQTNRLGVMAKDNQLTIYINGIKMATFTDAAHSSGQFGLMIRASENAPFVVNVDEFSYWELK